MPTEVDYENLSLDARSSTTFSLEWHTAEDEDGGEYTLTVNSDDDSDSTTASVGERPFDPKRWAVPTDSEWVLLEPDSVDTDYQTISITAHVGEKRRNQLKDLRTAGDDDIETTAMGAFRRFRRDGGPIRDIIPPTEWSPPFDSRPVVPLGYSEDEVLPGWYEVEVEYGLERPRGREPPTITRDPQVVASRRISLDARSESTYTFSWRTSPDDADSYDAQVRTTDPTGYEATDATSLTVSSQNDYSLSFATGAVGLEPIDVRPISRGSNAGVEEISVDLDLGAARVATLLATGSRVGASAIRSVPDGDSYAVDPLPDDDLSVTVRAPDESEIQSGEYVLMSWSVSRSDPVRKPYIVSLVLALVEEVIESDLLAVESGDRYVIPSGEVESYETVSVDGELVVDGELRVED